MNGTMSLKKSNNSNDSNNILCNNIKQQRNVSNGVAINRITICLQTHDNFAQFYYIFCMTLI